MIQTIEDLEKDLKYIPEPTHIFKVGDRVNIGALKDEVVKEVHFGGKGYTIEYTRTDNNYGNPIVSKSRIGIWAWMSIRKINDTEESLIQNENIFLNYSQRQIIGIFAMKYYFGLDMNPDYQREYVWNKEDKIALIDSIFNNIDIGKFVFNHLTFKTNSPGYEIVDGKQRVQAICDFYEDRFKYKDKYFSDLSYRDQDHFENYPISAAEISSASKKEIMQIFLMINSHGKIMDEEHLNKVRKIYEEEK